MLPYQVFYGVAKFKIGFAGKMMPHSSYEVFSIRFRVSPNYTQQLSSSKTARFFTQALLMTTISLSTIGEEAALEKPTNMFNL